jgi:hypothetical protein
VDASEDDQLAAAIAASLQNDGEEGDFPNGGSDEQEQKQEEEEEEELVPLGPEPQGENIICASSL